MFNRTVYVGDITRLLWMLREMDPEAWSDYKLFCSAAALGDPWADDIQMIPLKEEVARYWERRAIGGAA